MVMLSDSLFSLFFFFIIIFILFFKLDAYLLSYLEGKTIRVKTLFYHMKSTTEQVMVIHKMRRGALDKQIRKEFERNCSPTKKDNNHRNWSYI